MSIEHELRGLRAPDEPAAQERAWEVVRDARRDLSGARRGHRSRRVLVAPIVVALVAALALSPAGATVTRLIHQALTPRPADAPFALPAPGTLLLSGAGGTWTVRADGSVRRLGPFTAASWSPHGIYIAAASTRTLAAIAPTGKAAWQLAIVNARDPRWFSPSGYRIAYLAGASVRVVAGDGSGDALLAHGAAAVAPAWRPQHQYQLAYATERGRVVVLDATTGATLWSARPRAGTTLALGWTAGGTALVVLGRRGLREYRPGGDLRTSVGFPAAAPVLAGSLSPAGDALALQRGGTGSQLQVLSLSGSVHSPRTVLSGVAIRQIAWSPDGRWLLATAPTADEWLFVRVAGVARILATARVAERFGRKAPPSVDGWCCALAAGGH